MWTQQCCCRLHPDQRAWLGRFYFWSALILFALFVRLRLAAVRIYASGVLKLLQQGQLAPHDLHENERRDLAALGLRPAAVDSSAHRPPPTRSVLRFAGTFGALPNPSSR
jgi:hypothetical protein